MFRFVFKLGLFLILLVVVLEVFFRVVVPASSHPVTTQNHKYKVMQYDPDGPTRGLYTAGRQARHRARWQVNNLGWISSEDYTGKENKVRPRAVVIGNSYVEAIYLDVDKHLAPVAKGMLGQDVDFYTLGAWGVDLAQGITVSDYAREVLGPDLIVLVVTHGSLRRSVRNLAKRPFCLQVQFAGGEVMTHEPRPFRPNRLRHLVNMSATLRYVRVNARVALGGGAQEEAAFLKKTFDPESMTTEQLREQELMGRAARWIVEALAERNPGTNVLFLVDADRNVIQAGEKPVPIPTSSHLREAINGREGFFVLDLTETLWSDFRATNRPLHDSGDYHWNEHAVQVIGAALADFIKVHDLLATG